MASPERRDGVALVTGGTRGIGLHVARALARRGGVVLVAGRDEVRGAQVVEELLASGAREADFLRADLALQREVRALAAEVLAGWDRLDLLVNGAGTVQRRRVLAEDGVETTTAVNLLAPFRLTLELAPRLAASSPARVVNVTSAMQRRAELDLEALRDPGARYGWADAYARSKLALTVLTVEQAERLRDHGVTANAVHPGFIPGTGLARGMPWWARWGWGLMQHLPLPSRSTVDEGAEAVLEVAVGSLGEATGCYVAGGAARNPPPQARDPAIRRELWDWCAEAAGVDPRTPLQSPEAG